MLTKRAHTDAMNKLKSDRRSQIIRCLCEGNSMRATARLVDCSFNTVAKLLIEAGRACTKFQDKALHNLPCKRVQIDEVWGFVGAKDLNCSKEKKAQGWGSAWVWTALCADSKLLATWFIGPRVPQSAYHLYTIYASVSLPITVSKSQRMGLQCI